MSFKQISFCWLLLLISQTAIAEISISSPNTRVSLLELYTSEGCSSCPPADNWISKLKTHPQLWQSIVPVAFHVDYWNYIGWHDRFSSPDYSARQRRYASGKNVNTVYTPGFMLNGQEWRSFFNLRKLTLDNSSSPGQLSLKINEQEMMASFRPDNKKMTSGLLLNLAVLGFDIETRVKAGENRDRTLKHNFIVLGHKTIPMYHQGDHYSVMTTMPELVEVASRQAVAAWITTTTDLTPVQAAGGWLE